jgi:methylmalonyl-CoA mutase N-terminal domain/subunit
LIRFPCQNVSFNDHERCCTAHLFYIVAAEEQGVKPEQLSGTIQNDILKIHGCTHTPEPSIIAYF